MQTKLVRLHKIMGDRRVTSDAVLNVLRQVQRVDAVVMAVSEGIREWTSPEGRLLVPDETSIAALEFLASLEVA